MNQAQIFALLRQQGATVEEAMTLSAIAMAESGGIAQKSKVDPNSWGLFQINLDAHPLSVAQAMDPETSAAYALKLFREQGGQPWSVYTNGTYAQHMDPRKIVLEMGQQAVGGTTMSNGDGTKKLVLGGEPGEITVTPAPQLGPNVYIVSIPGAVPQIWEAPQNVTKVTARPIEGYPGSVGLYDQTGNLIEVKNLSADAAASVANPITRPIPGLTGYQGLFDGDTGKLLQLVDDKGRPTPAEITDFMTAVLNVYDREVAAGRLGHDEAMDNLTRWGTIVGAQLESARITNDWAINTADILQEGQSLALTKAINQEAQRLERQKAASEQQLDIQDIATERGTEWAKMLGRSIPGATSLTLPFLGKMPLAQVTPTSLWEQQGATPLNQIPPISPTVTQEYPDVTAPAVGQPAPMPDVSTAPTIPPLEYPPMPEEYQRFMEYWRKLYGGG